MLALHTVLDELAAHPRAVAWRVTYQVGLSGSTVGRTFTWFAPPLQRSVAPLLHRIHNGIILLQPASVHVEAPIDTLPGLDQLRNAHHLPILVGDQRDGLGADRDLPAVEDRELPEPGPGLALGLDIGGTGMKACALDARGAVLKVASAPTWPDGEGGIDSLIRRARALVTEVAGDQPIGSLGIGLASPMGVRGRVHELSTVMRARVGDVAAFDQFPERVADGLVDGPVAVFNDLINLGRQLSADGARRLARVQIGTSFGGCWIDADGAVVATEMARLVVDAAPDARPHPYLPLSGAARQYLSNAGVAIELGGDVDPRQAGLRLRELLRAGDPLGARVLDAVAASLSSAVAEMSAVLVGLLTVEVGGSMLQGPAGAGLLARLEGQTTVPVRIAAQPGHDGAIAAARAPRVHAALRAMRRVG